MKNIPMLLSTEKDRFNAIQKYLNDVIMSEMSDITQKGQHRKPNSELPQWLMRVCHAEIITSIDVSPRIDNCVECNETQKVRDWFQWSSNNYQTIKMDSESWVLTTNE